MLPTIRIVLFVNPSCVLFESQWERRLGEREVETCYFKHAITCVHKQKGGKGGTRLVLVLIR